jgi:hypothetical protein
MVYIRQVTKSDKATQISNIRKNYLFLKGALIMLYNFSHIELKR